MTVWDELIGQQRAVATLKAGVAGEAHAMSHAWLITGPAGSGRSNAAKAFAAALQCPDGGCGECQACRTALSGAHPDVTVMRTEELSIGIDAVRDLVRRASMSPTLKRYQLIVIEDADRMTDRAADALLKAIEEPAPRTVWILCAPTPEDVIITIRSRCRQLNLVTPAAADVERLLVQRDGIDPEIAAVAARAAQGHVGRARALARSQDARDKRAEILAIPTRLTSLGACVEAAAQVVAAAKEEAAHIAQGLEQAENEELDRALGFGTKGAKPKNTAGAKKDLEQQQKARRTRLERDAIDRVLVELTAYYRDVIALQTQAAPELINSDYHGALSETA
ncbi:MAG: DNA polymerase III subunit delta', partial [Propionibacteriaceae bacterium]